MDNAMVTLEAHLHPMAPAWPLGADNTTGSLSDDAGSQISVRSWAVLVKLPEAVGTYLKRCMSIDHEKNTSKPQKKDPIFLHVKAGMAVIIKQKDGTWHMADVVNVIGSAKSPKVPKYFQVKYVDNHVTNWVNADLVSHIVPRVWTAGNDAVWESHYNSAHGHDHLDADIASSRKRPLHSKDDFVFGVTKASIQWQAVVIGRW